MIIAKFLDHLQWIFCSIKTIHKIIKNPDRFIDNINILFGVQKKLSTAPLRKAQQKTD